MAQHVQATHTGKVKVEDQEVEGIRGQGGDGLISIPRPAHAEAITLEHGADKLKVDFVVLRDKDDALRSRLALLVWSLGLRCHAPPLIRGCCSGAAVPTIPLDVGGSRITK